MDKAQNFSELEAWEQRLKKAVAGRDLPLTYLVTLKFDGLTVNLTYDGAFWYKLLHGEQGRLVRQFCHK